MLINAFAKKQVAVSHSTTESEMISLEEGVRTDRLQVLTFWEYAAQFFCEPDYSKLAAATLQRTTALRKPATETEKAESESEPEQEEKEDSRGALFLIGHACVPSFGTRPTALQGVRRRTPFGESRGIAQSGN